MSKAQPIRTRPDPPETLPGQTTTLVRADPRSAGESGTQWHPQLHAHLRELQLRTGSSNPDIGDAAAPDQ